MSTPALEPTLLGPPPPPITHDRVTQTWAVVSTLSWLGDNVLDVALAWTAVRLLPPSTAGLVIACALFPQGVLMLVGGLIADRYDTRTVLVVGEVGRAVVLAIAAAVWAAGWHSAAVLVLVGVTFGVAAGLTNPARMTLLRQLVSGDGLTVATGWLQIGSRVGSLLGAPLGAFVVRLGGMATAMAIDAATFVVVAAALLGLVHVRYRLPRHPQAPWHTALADCARYLRRDTRAGTLLIALLAPNVFLAPALSLGVPLRINTSGWTVGWLGIAEAACAVAGITGSAAALRWRPARPIRAGFGVLLVQGVGILLTGVDSPAAVLAGMLVVGATAGSGSVWISAAYQQAIDPAYLGRVSSLSQIGDLLIIPGATPAYGAVAARAGVTAASAAFGIGMSLMCGFFASRRAFAQAPAHPRPRLSPPDPS